jgi:hypothetical protein
MRALLLILFILLSLPASATYTKIANNGALLAASATLGSGPTDWACSRDNATGLIWEVKTTSGLRGQDNTYSNYDSVYGTAAQIAAASNSLGFVTAVNAASLCGYGEWRRPGKEELQGISDLSFFPNTPRALFWTSTPLAGDAASAYDVDFANAGVFTDLRSLASRVRLVRSPPSSSFALTITASGSGSGSVNSGGIACSSVAAWVYGTCTAQRSGSVTLTATPASGSVFAGWSGACSGHSLTCTVSMESAKTVQAAFLPPYSKIANNGAELPDSALLSVGVGDWACTRDNSTGLLWEVKTADGGLRDISKTYTNYDSNYGTTAQIAAASNSIGFANAVNSSSLCGYGDWHMPSKDELLAVPFYASTLFPNTPWNSRFWSGSPDATDSSYAWVVCYDYNCQNYSPSALSASRSNNHQVRLVRGGQSSGTFALSISASGVGSGSVNSGGIDCASVAGTTSGHCTAEHGTGSSITLTATPAPGSLFTGWGGACSGSASTCTLTMDAAKSASAHFDFGPLVNGACGLANGQTLTAEPITHLCTAGSASGVNGSAALTWLWRCSGFSGGLPAACSATFSSGLFALSVSKSGSGQVLSTLPGIDCGSDCGGGYASGSSVTLTATPAAGNHWVGWGGACSGISPTCTLTMNASKAVTATFTTYSKVANNGADLPASALLGSGAGDWACTRENSTGLLWEVKTDDGGLRDMNKTYTNYDSTYGSTAQINAATNSIGLVNAVNSSSLCAVQGWRMPSKDELSGLVDTNFVPTIDPTFFINTPSSTFWSGSPVAGYSSYSSYAWVVTFGGGYVDYDYRSRVNQVRLVRGGQSFGTFALSLSSSGPGSGTFSADAGNFNCTSNAGTTSGTCADNLPSGVLVTLTASPAPGSRFAGWGGACSGASLSCTLKMNAAQNVSAVFKTGPAPVSPGAPTNISFIAGSGSAQFSFTAPTNDGGAAISGYTATCTAIGQTTRRANGSRSPLTVRNLVGNVPYQCTLTASNEAGSSEASDPSSVTPTPGKKNSLTPILMLLLD